MKTTKDLLKKVKLIELNTKQLVDGLIAGNYHSVFKGQGIEFSEIRDYRPGDDIRTIDWKVTARYNHPFVKEFIEERDLRVIFLVDFSASGSFGNNIEKKNKAIQITASLMFSALRNNDSVGLFIFTDKVEKYIPARKGKRHILKLLKELLTFNPDGKETNLSKSLNFVGNVLKRKSLVFLISDFYSDSFMKPLSALRHRHDIVSVRIRDKRELEIPDVGLIELEDEETGEQILVDTSDPEFRQNYIELIKSNDVKLKTSFIKNKIDMIDLSSDTDLELELKNFFKMRQRKVVF